MEKYLSNAFMTWWFLALIFAVLAYATYHGLRKTEIAECNTWVDQAATIPNWFAADWQVEQCNEYQINLWK